MKAKRVPNRASRTKNAIKRKVHATFTRTVDSVSIPELFRYASRNQKLLAMLGFIAAAINGLPMPIMLILYGKTTDKFVSTTFCDAFKFYNVSELCPPEVDESNINQLYYKCNWNETNLSVPALAGSVGYDSLYFTIIGIILWMFSWLQTTLLANACERIVCNVRIVLFRSILSKPVSWFDRHDTGSINSYFAATIDKFKQGVGDKIGMLAQAAVTVIASIVICLCFDWRLSLVLYSLSPIFIASSGYFTSAGTKSAGIEQKTYGKASSIAQQTFSNIRTVHAFNGLDNVQQKYESNLDQAKHEAIKKGLINSGMLSLLWLVMYASTALGFWYGAKRIEQGVTVGVILIVFFGMQTSVFSLGSNLTHYNALVEAKSAAYLLYETIGNSSGDKDSIKSMLGHEKSTFLIEPQYFAEKIESGKPFVPGDIRFNSVTFSYPSRPDVKILDDVNLVIPEGMKVALIGESGSGKSTVAQLLMGFYNLQRGTITFGNTSIDNIDISHLRSQIGLVSQEPVLFTATIAENIRLGKPDATDEEIRAACKAANALKFIEDFPLKFETQVGESGSQLSGGQKQRIAIARALISNPPILILDEATSALDSESEKCVQEALDVASRGRTTLIIAHRLSTIRNADLIIAMAHGKVVETGTHDELMATDGVYKRLVQAQSKYQDDEEYNDIVPRQQRRRHLTSIGSQVFDEEETNVEPPQSTGKIIMYLLKMNSREAMFIVLGCLACMTFGVMQIVYEMFFARILITFSHCDNMARMRLISKQALDFLWIAAVTGLSQALSSASFTFSGEKLTKRLRKRVFGSLVKQEIGFFDRAENSVGALCTILSSEASAVQGATGIRIGTTLSGISILIAGLAVSFKFGWQLSLVILAFVPVLIISGVISMQVYAGFDAGDKKYLEAAGRIIVESTSNIRLVKQLRQEKYFSRKYEENVNFVRKRNLKRTIITGFLFGFSQGFAFFAVAATYYAGAKFIEKQLMTSEDLMIVFGTLLFGAMAVGQSQAMAPDFGKAVQAAKRVFAILHRKPEIDAKSDEGLIPELYKGNFCIEHVSFTYPTRKNVRALKNVTLHLSPNEEVALVGTSGCGKSTIIQLLMRFYDPIKGHITLDGVDIKKLNLKWYRRRMGIVSQEPVLFDWSIAENIAFGDTDRQVTMEEIQQAAKSANIHDFISKLPQGYNTLVGSRGSLISGGQKQRICIARAIIRNPALLLLDEATSALDTESEKIVQEALNTVQQGRTSVSVAHRLSTIEKCSKIFVLDEGRVVEQGDHNSLMSQKGLYSDLYQLSTR